MIAAYQRFYEVDARSTSERNRGFFPPLRRPQRRRSAARRLGGDELAGYACLYWFFTSTQAAETRADERPLRRPSAGAERGRPGADRGQRRGRARAAAPATSSGRRRPDNAAAQRLYDSTGAERSTWVTYELRRLSSRRLPSAPAVPAGQRRLGVERYVLRSAARSAGGRESSARCRSGRPRRSAARSAPARRRQAAAGRAGGHRSSCGAPRRPSIRTNHP